MNGMPFLTQQMRSYIVLIVLIGGVGAQDSTPPIATTTTMVAITTPTTTIPQTTPTPPTTPTTTIPTAATIITTTARPTTPSAVSGLTATETGSGTATVSWPNSSGVWTKVRITCSPSCGPPTEVNYPADSTVISGLTLGQSYTFTAVVLSGTAESAGVTSNSLTISPSPVSVLTATKTGFGTATISWPNPSGVWTKVRITCSPSCGSSSEVNYPAASADISGLTPGQNYTFTAVVLSGTAESAGVTSNSVTITAGVPNGLTLNQGGSETAVTLRWIAPANAVYTGYRVEWSSTIAGCTDQSSDVSNTILTHSITSLTPGCSYDFSVRSVTAEGTQSEPSTPPISYTAGSSAVTQLTASIKGSNSITIQWTRGEGRQDDFDMHSSGGSPGGITGLDGGPYTQTYTGLSSDTNYTFALRSQVNDVASLPDIKYSDFFNATFWTDEAIPVAEQILPELRKDWISDEDVSKSRIAFTLTDNITQIFSADTGMITHYQILVWGTSSNSKKPSVEPPLTWARAKKVDFKEPYAIGEKELSPIKWKELTTKTRRKRAAKGLTIIIGRDSDCEREGEDVYCNGPLQAKSDYCVYVRGFTVAGSADSDCVVLVQTKSDDYTKADDYTKSDYTPIIVGVVVASIAVIAAIGVIIFFYRRLLSNQQSSTHKPQSATLELSAVDSLPLSSDDQTYEKLRRRDDEYDTVGGEVPDADDAHHYAGLQIASAAGNTDYTNNSQSSGPRAADDHIYYNNEMVARAEH